MPPALDSEPPDSFLISTDDVQSEIVVELVEPEYARIPPAVLQLYAQAIFPLAEQLVIATVVPA